MGAMLPGVFDTDPSVLSMFLSESDPTDWLIDSRELTLEEEVGAGAFAHVFRGSYSGQRVAVKRFNGTPAIRGWQLVDRPRRDPQEKAATYVFVIEAAVERASTKF
jgi:hypothetical protein